MTYDIDIIRLEVKLRIKTKIKIQSLGACEILNEYLP